ncbi:MAG: acyl-CoA dehydrogenase family protein [Acidimicrobiales bacterium]
MTLPSRPVDLRLSPAEERFRTELAGWLAGAVASLPPKPAPDDWPARRVYDTSWQRTLHDAGYAGITWPREFGGRGASPTEDLILLEETARARAPYIGANFVGLLHAGPTLIAEATDEQRSRYLPPILRGEEVWCQGFSEPGAGSDLASLRTRAVRDGDHYVITGQKIWTSHAHIADFCELLVRTDPDAPKHRGISWLILPMDTPGVEVRPLRSILGTGEFNEMFLDEVRVPVGNLVGAENDGWRVAMVTFSFERGTAFVGEMMDTVELLAEVARTAGPGADAGICRELGRLRGDLDALWALTRRNVSEAARTGSVGVGGSVFKLHYSEVRHRLGALAMRLLPRDRLCVEDPLVRAQIHAVSLGIAAGTTQIQRNIVGERILGLPKER